MKLERALASNLSWIPILAAMILPVTFTITYGWSVSLELVEPWFPTISNTGAYPPVSCFFSLMLSIESFVLFIVVFFRHRQLMDHYEHDYDKSVNINIPKHSSIAMYIGVVACVGLIIVGNFQSVNVPIWHSIGGALAFFIGTVYMAYQTFLSYKCEVSLTKKFNSHFRVFCTVGAILSIISMFINMVLYTIKEVDEPLSTTAFPFSSTSDTSSTTSPPPTPSTPCPVDPAAPFIVASALSEWCIALFLVLFIFTFTPEFRRIRFLEIVLEMNYGRRSTTM